MENLKKISENIKKSLETFTFPSRILLKDTSSMEKEEICTSLLTSKKVKQKSLLKLKIRKKGTFYD